MIHKYDYLIVGAGLFGSVFAYISTKAGKKCLVIDRRNHVGGNLYCKLVENINVHYYGAHIFHTSDTRVWDFVNSLVPFNQYINSPMACAPDGNIYNLPFNMNTFSKLWNIKTPEEAVRILEVQRQEARDRMNRKGISEPRNLEEQALLLIGKDIYSLLIKEYTEKQWGRSCTELPPFIIRRLPIRLTYDNNYFNDKYQGIPIGGYNVLINRLLDGSDVRLGTDFSEIKNEWRGVADTLVYTGAVDEYFDFKLGRLQYRTVVFKHEILETPNFQGNAVVNYTSSKYPWTRIIEHKHFESFGNEVYNNSKTVISKEFSKEYIPGDEPYYPINDDINESLAEQYRQLAKTEQNVIFGGRLAEYKYYDMGPIISKAIKSATDSMQTKK